ncbi:hypothetical protein BGW38_009672 [Lunasporangiospora selenospora]|uniref:Uncharacterized protein n=1 Tax=Lunasporangiospora selenospora TaxID=979761 RepID=A0A9P6FXD8_9FUNG|nr:hypothetical protein BGW38_009672 [Lunasporangiospora selenospora]
MPPKEVKFNVPKKKQRVEKTANKPNDAGEAFLNEILALGGSKQDMDLLNDIDSDSELEVEEEESTQIKNVAQSSSKKKTKGSEAIVEPGLTKEVATFMKSLFGKSLANTEQAAQVEEEEEEEEEWESDDDGASNGSWESIEEDMDESNDIQADDSGDDSMDDLPDELRNIASILNKKETETKQKMTSSAKTESNPPSNKKQSSTETKKVKKESTIPPSKKQAEITKKAKSSTGVQKTSSASTTKISPDMGSKLSAIASAAAESRQVSKKRKGPDVDEPRKKKQAKASPPTKKVDTTKQWSLGDGWNKAFEDDSDDDNHKSGSKKAKNKGNNAKKKVQHTQGKKPVSAKHRSVQRK